MKRELFIRALHIIENQTEWDFFGCLKSLQETFPDENVKTLRSILSKRYMLRAQVRGEEAKEESRSLFKEFEAKKKSGTEMGYLAVIAKKRNYPPSIVARLVLREWYRKYEKRTLDRNEIIDLVKDYWKIPDPGLGLEVYKADISDTACGTICDAIRHAMGVQYEELTKKALDDLRVPERLSIAYPGRKIGYMDEAAMRKAGYDKTPDIKLEVPFAVNNRVINWIESKALFGDEEVHADYLKNQLFSYWNRFGPGMVIYHFGFIDEIADMKKYEGILVTDKFPAYEDIVFMDPFHDYKEEFTLSDFDPSGSESSDSSYEKFREDFMNYDPDEARKKKNQRRQVERTGSPEEDRGLDTESDEEIRGLEVYSGSSDSEFEDPDEDPEELRDLVKLLESNLAKGKDEETDSTK